jgi:glycolate oxidase iron-sulfur subunit
MHVSLPPTKHQDPFFAAAATAFQACVHCGFCNTTCPTYALLGDERDGPRGRIYAMKDMLEGAVVERSLVPHLDRCLSCLACRTTCPSGVDYTRLIDLGRAQVAEGRRWTLQGLARRALAVVMTRPTLLRLAVVVGKAVSRFPIPGSAGAAARVARGADPRRSAVDGSRVFPAVGPQRARVALLTGCVQRAVAPEINEATVRLLRRMGCEVVVLSDVRCCGSLDHHLGHTARAHRFGAQALASWHTAHKKAGLDYIVSNTSGCGAHLKDIAFQMQKSAGPASAHAAELGSLMRDVSEVAAALGLPDAVPTPDLEVTYQSACTLQHGQRIRDLPQTLLREAGFRVRGINEDHLCCGSAGTYNIMQPDLSACLGERKARNIERTDPSVVATGNVGCMLQLRNYTGVPVVHTVELLDWATGGPRPLSLDRRDARDA